jgi:hypothetical protein
MPNGRRIRNFCFTVNNYTEAEFEALQSIVEDPKVRYAVVGVERGDGGTPHLQGYAELSDRLSLGNIKQLPGLSRAHVEERRGTQAQAIEYCQKEGQWFEVGTRKRPGSRSDLDSVKVSLDQHRSLRRCSEEHFPIYLQYRRGLADYLSLTSTPRSWKTATRVYWGPTGVGKTKRVMDECMESSPFIVPDTTLKWFDGYEGQENVLIDDFEPKCDFRFLLRLLDRYPMHVPVKGGFVNWAPRTLYITANSDPVTWFANPPFWDGDERYDAPLIRRLDFVERMV